ncbi:MAG: hypothetical protein ACOZHQ_17230 [Thermodesulfobacteriota bacterium]
MKSVGIKIAVAWLVALALAASGCAYTTVVAKERVPQPGPPVKAGLKAVMPMVSDQRTWPDRLTADQPIPNVRIFAPQMTDVLRQELLASGLFSALPAPKDPAAGGLVPTLKITVGNFALSNLGTNAWVVPHLLLDGVALPLFTATALYSKGRVDMGGYITPSSRIGTLLAASVEFSEGLAAPVLERKYLIRYEVEQASEREMLSDMRDYAGQGVDLGKAKGVEALRELARAIASDPNWQSLPQLRRLVAAEQVVKAGRPLPEQARAVEEVLDLLDSPLTMTEEEVKVLRDGFLDAKARATIINDLRARWLGLSGPAELPAEQFVDEAAAEKLFDDPRLPFYAAASVIDQRVIALAVKVLTPVEPTVKRDGGQPAEVVSLPPGPMAPAADVAVGSPGTASPDLTPAGAPDLALAAPAPPTSPAQAQALRESLRQALAARIKGDLRKQVLAATEAEKAVGPAWQPMAQLLRLVDTPFVQRYLGQRAG